MQSYAIFPKHTNFRVKKKQKQRFFEENDVFFTIFFANVCIIKILLLILHRFEKQNAHPMRLRANL